MAIERRALKGGRLKAGAYDEGRQQLELAFGDGSVRIYKSVPAEVWRRLLAAPNPASYHDDRIAEEYPMERGSAAAEPDAKARLDALFGSPPAKD